MNNTIINKYIEKMRPYTDKSEELKKLVDREINLATGCGWLSISAVSNIKKVIAMTAEDLEAEIQKEFKRGFYIYTW